MSFTVRNTIDRWGNVREYLLARKDILSEFAMYDVGKNEGDWTVDSDKEGKFIYLKGLVLQETGLKIHLSCNVVNAVWDTFHVTEDHSGGVHVASLRVVKLQEEDESVLYGGYEYSCISDGTIIGSDGKHSKMKIGKKETQRVEKIKAKGGKISSPKKDMKHLVNAMIASGIEWL
jgi:hypothetical protein